MAQDDKVIGYISPAELLDVMRETGMISVQETGTVDGKPVIHASLKVINAQTGEELPGGLPFSVVMFKGATEPGYSNIAIGTVVPAAELEIALPADFFNLCNRRFRFIRVFPLDASSFVLQMDLFVRNTTVEYIKFSFGLWAALFSQVLFELMGRGSQSLSRAAEVYATAPVDFVGRTAEVIAAAPVAENLEEADLLDLPPDPVAATPQSDAVKETESDPDAESAPDVESAPQAEAPMVLTPAADEIAAEKTAEPEEVGIPPEKTVQGDEKAPAAAEATPSAEKAETAPV